MAENTKIEWAHHTVNFWAGCTKISPGCDGCYAEKMARRLWGMGWGPGTPRRHFLGAADTLVKLDRKAQKQGEKQRAFINSMSDLFDNEVDDADRMDAFEAMSMCESMIFLLLTKRIGNVGRYLQHDKVARDLLATGRAWIGASITSQAEADRDIPKLLAVPGAKRFLSMEPLLGPVDIDQIPDPAGGICLKPLAGIRWMPLGGDKVGSKPQSTNAIDWVIVGGESGPNARPMHPDWARSLRDQCQAAGVPFLFKQWGEWGAADQITDQTGDSLYTEDLSALRVRSTAIGLDGRTSFDAELVGPGPATVYRVGKKAAGRLLDGRTWDEVPS